MMLEGICVSRPPALALAPGPGPGPGRNLYLAAPVPNFYFTAPALNLYLRAPALNLCLPILRFAVKVCYSCSVCLYKLSVCTNLLSIIWAISELQLFEISSQEIFPIFLIWLNF